METIDGKKLLGARSFHATAQAGLSFATTARNRAILSAGDAALSVTVLAPAEYAGTYPLDPVALATGPVALRPPELAGDAAQGVPLTARPALWAHDGAVAEPSRGWRWQRDGVDIPGATDATFTPAETEAGAQLRVVETVTGAGAAVSVASAPVLVAA